LDVQVTNDLYGYHGNSLSIMNIDGARRAGHRRRKACRLWVGGGRGILCRHAHSLFELL